MKIPPRSEIGVALEEFLDDFEALFDGEVRGEHEAEVTPGKATAHRVSDPSVPESFQNEIMLEGDAGPPVIWCWGVRRILIPYPVIGISKRPVGQYMTHWLSIREQIV